MAYESAGTPGGRGSAQAVSNIQRVEQAIPFGTVAGDLICSGEHLIFVDDEERRSSFAISRDHVKDMRQEGASITIALARPVKTRSGESSTVSFRFSDPEGVRMISAWMPAPGAVAAAASETMAFQVKHKHLIGADEGRLTITPVEVDYRSLTNFNASRRWKMSEIKEVKRDNPHSLAIVPFTGEQYKFEVVGPGVATEQFNRLVDYITSQRH
jgi:hypothetical protein